MLETSDTVRVWQRCIPTPSLRPPATLSPNANAPAPPAARPGCALASLGALPFCSSEGRAHLGRAEEWRAPRWRRRRRRRQVKRGVALLALRMPHRHVMHQGYCDGVPSRLRHAPATKPPATASEHSCRTSGGCTCTMCRPLPSAAARCSLLPMRIHPPLPHHRCFDKHAVDLKAAERAGLTLDEAWSVDEVGGCTGAATGAAAACTRCRVPAFNLH